MSNLFGEHRMLIGAFTLLLDYTACWINFRRAEGIDLPTPVQRLFNPSGTQVV
jgi:hypothetical protein